MAGSGKLGSAMVDESRKQGDSRPKAKRCPICGKPAQEATKPFCSSRCRNVDLNRWLSGSYVIPASEVDEDDVE